MEVNEYLQSEKYKEALDHYKKRINQLADKEIKSRRAAETTASLEEFEKNSSINEYTDNIREKYKSKLEKQLEAEGDYKYSTTPPASSKTITLIGPCVPSGQGQKASPSLKILTDAAKTSKSTPTSNLVPCA